MSEMDARVRITFTRSVSWFRVWKHSRRRWVLWTRWFSVWVNFGERLPKDDGWPS